MEDQQISHFVGITGAEEDIARQLLEIANGDLGQAVVLYYDTDMAETLRRQAASTATVASGSGQASGAQRSRGREDEDGVIHIDSDDNNSFGGDDYNADDQDMQSDDGQVVDTDVAVAQTVARSAQEEEDEAMAKRLQQEMYSENAAAENGVRAPIARTTEVLVEPSYGAGYGDYSGAAMGAPFDRLARRQQAWGGPANPFSQVWDNDNPMPIEDDGVLRPPVPGPSSRAARLADLFRPPYELIDRLSWDEARLVGKEEKKWILANIQDMSDFQCQALNRDIWKDKAVWDLVRENFIFLQYSKDDPRAESYIQYYMPGGQHENPDNYPHVGIVDPRTGEQVKTWTGRPFPTAAVFHAQLAEFLDRYSLDSAKKNPVQQTKSREAPKDVGRMTEDEMLEMALQNSLATSGGTGGGGSGSGTTSRPSVQDPDELTGSGADERRSKRKASDADSEDDNGDADEGAAESAAAVESAESAVFARIASDRPHTEPANNPATVTRIQFRHPTGRVIRRFAVSDPVQRIYEWLKAEPLEGKEGVEFELKTVPQSRDLIEDLDRTIEDAGLKQATVMIEFIE